MRTLIRLLPVISILMMIPRLGTAADTLKIHLTYKHKLDEAGRTQGYITINQKFYTPDDVLFREINYNEKNGQIENYIYYFYEGGRISTAECYSHKDSLLYIVKHEYNGTGKEIAELRYEPLNGVPQVMRKTAKSYDKNGRLLSLKEYTGKKLGASIRYKYEIQGLLAQENRKFKPISKQPLKTQAILYSYNPDKTLRQVIHTGKDLSNKTFQESEDFTYNEKGLLSTIKITGTNYPAGLVKTYKYLISGSLSFCQESDAAGKNNKILQYDYKKHYMDRGVQVSYFDKTK
jgi:hypothetical protein